MEKLNEMTEERLIELCINKNLYDIWHTGWEIKCGHPYEIHMAAHELSNRINKLKDDNKRLLNFIGKKCQLAKITDDDIQWALKNIKDNNDRG